MNNGVPQSSVMYENNLTSGVDNVTQGSSLENKVENSKGMSITHPIKEKDDTLTSPLPVNGDIGAVVEIQQSHDLLGNNGERARSMLPSSNDVQNHSRSDASTMDMNGSVRVTIPSDEEGSADKNADGLVGSDVVDGSSSGKSSGETSALGTGISAEERVLDKNADGLVGSDVVDGSSSGKSSGETSDLGTGISDSSPSGLAPETNLLLKGDTAALQEDAFKGKYNAKNSVNNRLSSILNSKHIVKFAAPIAVFSCVVGVASIITFAILEINYLGNNNIKVASLSVATVAAVVFIISCMVLLASKLNDKKSKPIDSRVNVEIDSSLQDKGTQYHKEEMPDEGLWTESTNSSLNSVRHIIHNTEAQVHTNGNSPSEAGAPSHGLEDISANSPNPIIIINH